MEIYDILMLIVLVVAAVFGAIKGFAWQLTSIASIVASYIVAYQFREPFSQAIHAEPPWNRFLAMLILYVGTSLVIWVAFRMVSGTIDRLKLREFDRHVGAVFGLAKGALFCTLIKLFAVTLLGDGLREKIVASKSGRYIAKVLDQSESVIPPEIHEVVRPYLQRFDERFKGTATDAETGGLMPWIADRVINGQSTQNPADDRLPDVFWDATTGSQYPVSTRAAGDGRNSNSPASSQPYGQSTYGQSSYGQLAPNQPSDGQPGYAQPTYNQPSYNGQPSNNGLPSAYGRPSSYRSP